MDALEHPPFEGMNLLDISEPIYRTMQLENRPGIKAFILLLRVILLTCFVSPSYVMMHISVMKHNMLKLEAIS